MERIYVCSSNAGKLADFALALTGIHLEALPGLKGIPPPVEDGSSFDENARKKALYYSQFCDDPVLSDDSGLEVQALGGAPGIYSARYAGEGATDEANRRLLLANLSREANRSARFVCALAIAQQGRILYTAEGTVEGQILLAARGEGGFGYDSLFFYPPFGRSFAEITPLERFAVSHRGHALRRLARAVAIPY